MLRDLHYTTSVEREPDAQLIKGRRSKVLEGMFVPGQNIDVYYSLFGERTRCAPE